MSKLDTFIEILKELLEDNNLNIERFSVLINCNRNAIGLWLTGKYYPRVNSLIKIANTFECSIDYLFGLCDSPSIDLSEHPSDFHTRFSELSAQSNLSDYRIAKLCGIGNSAIAKWRYLGQIPGTETLLELTEIFDCSLEYLIGRSDKK